tara:strand:+ start:8192 stop:8404 length:213 start_codon:yes stop_codon:yes gene_type:complete
MEFILEVLAYILIELIFQLLIKLPGTTILWLYHGRKKTLKNSINESDLSSVILGILFWLVIVGLISLILN